MKEIKNDPSELKREEKNLVYLVKIFLSNNIKLTKNLENESISLQKQKIDKNRKGVIHRFFRKNPISAFLPQSSMLTRGR